MIAQEWWQIDANSYPSRFDYVAMALTVVGFVIAFCQLARTRRLQAQRVLTEEQTSNAIIENQISSYLSDLQSVIGDLEHALRLGNDDLGQHALARYAGVSASTASLMRKRDDTDTTMPERLEASSRDASAAREDIVMRGLTLKYSIRSMYGELSQIAVWAAQKSTALVFTVPAYGAAANRKKGR